LTLSKLRNSPSSSTGPKVGRGFAAERGRRGRPASAGAAGSSRVQKVRLRRNHIVTLLQRYIGLGNGRGHLAILLPTSVVAKTFWGFLVVNRCNKRHVQHTCAIVISEDDDQAAARI